MSWQLRHTWRDGASILTGKLACCTHCGTLRVVERSRQAGLFEDATEERTHYIMPGRGEAERIRYDEPPCITLERRGSLSSW
jgi:hypothetical protein